MIKLNDNGELLLNRLMNAIDKLALHCVPIEDWDGEQFKSKDLSDYPNPADVPDSPSIMLGRSVGGTTAVVPAAILSEIWAAMAGENGMPGLEDYVSGDWRDETP